MCPERLVVWPTTAAGVGACRRAVRALGGSPGRGRHVRLRGFGPDLAIPATQQNHYGYGQAYALLGAVFLGALAVPVGFALGLAFAAMARRRTELYTD